MASNYVKDNYGLRLALADAASQSYLAVDTEFIRETTFFPKIALIQIATDKTTWIIDPLAFRPEELHGLKSILTDPKILKIMHATYADQECFYWAYGFIATPVLDTAVAAGLLGLGDNIGLSKLLKEVLDLHIPKGRSRVKWLERPLAKELLEYAELDVRYLVRLGTTLLKRLEAKRRKEWALELSKSVPEQFDEDPAKMAERLGRNVHWGNPKGPAVFAELVRWREKRVKELNIPRAWLCDNDVLVSLAKVHPKTAQELKSFRGLSPKEIDRSGEHILQAIKNGIEKPEEEPIERSTKKKGDPHTSPIADLIQTYVYFLATELEMIPRYLLTSDQAFRLVENSKASIEEWVRTGILNAPASQLIGSDLKDILEGRKGLIVKNHKLTVFSVPV